MNAADDPIATYREHVARALSLCGGGGPADDEDDDTQPGPRGPDEQDEEHIQ